MKNIFDRLRALAVSPDSAATLVIDRDDAQDLQAIIGAATEVRRRVSQHGLSTAGLRDLLRALDQHVGCFQDPASDGARCGLHDTVPDWSSECPNYAGPAGWICPDGGLFGPAPTSTEIK